MCLEIDKIHKNQKLLENTIAFEENQEIFDVNMEEENSYISGLNLKTLCGGSLINHKPVFDLNGE